MGIGTKKSCKDALNWYKAAADAAMRTFNSGPPGGRHLPPPKIRLSDINGGAYGPGASSSVRTSVTGGSTSQTQQEWDDLLEYHHFHANRGRGEPRYMFLLGRLYYQGFGGSGLGGVRGGRSRLNVGEPGLDDKLADGGRDFVKASRWFLALASKVWRKDTPREAFIDTTASKTKGHPARFHYDANKDPKLTTDEQAILFAGLAAGYLGRMYMRGEGTAPNYAKAYLWFARGAAQVSPIVQLRPTFAVCSEADFAGRPRIQQWIGGPVQGRFGRRARLEKGKLVLPRSGSARPGRSSSQPRQIPFR